MTLKTFSTMPTHIVNTCDKFYWNFCTEYRDTASCKTSLHVNGQQQIVRWKYGTSKNLLPPNPNLNLWRQRKI